jgi:hypothetical protein
MTPRLVSSWWSFITQKASHERYFLMHVAERYFCSCLKERYTLSALLHRALRWNCDASCRSSASQLAPLALLLRPQSMRTSHRTTRQPLFALTRAANSDRTRGQRSCRFPGCVVVPLWILYRAKITDFSVLLCRLADKYQAGLYVGEGVLLKTGLYSLKAGTAWGLEVVEGRGTTGWDWPPSGLLSCSVPSTMENPLGV